MTQPLSATQQTPSPTAPPKYWKAVSPSDSVDFSASHNTPLVRCLWVGTGGNVAVVDADGNAVTLANVPSGYLLPGYFKRVNSTNTGASNIVAAW